MVKQYQYYALGWEKEGAKAVERGGGEGEERGRTRSGMMR